jgi:ribosome-associated translation inhibitor RaiA
MKISSFDRTTVKNLRSDIDKALATISKKYGIEISAGNASFTSSNVTYKVQAAVKAAGGVTMTKEASDFNLYASINLSGFKLGQTISLQGKEYTIAGWKVRAQRNPVIVTRDGKSYRVSTEMIKMYNK